jgi:23S rRNA (guanosine2251-2'-O)-methyltransferase
MRRASYLKTRKTAQPGKSRSPDVWIYGLNPVIEALRSGSEIRKIVVSASRRDLALLMEREATLLGVKLLREDPAFFESRFPKGHQGIAAVVSPREYLGLEELLSIPAGKGEIPLFVVLDCLEDPRNLGAILRVADAGGVHGVVIQSHRSVTLGPEAIKASAGAAQHIPIAMVANVKHAIRAMKEAGITVVGAEAEAGRTVWETDLAGPLALVIGSEGKGLRRTVKESCDVLVSLPMKGKVNSLNASVATGIIIFELMRQKNSQKKPERVN